MTCLTLSLLGPIQFLLDGEPVRGIKSDKVRALLIYLAVEAERPHRREMLAGLLWPDLPDQDATSNLRYALYNLRKTLGDNQALPPYLLISRESLQFNQASAHQLDVAQFLEYAEAETSGRSELSQLWEAVELYRGPFLQDFSLSDCPSFEEWALVKREMMGRQMFTILQDLAEYHGQRHEPEQAERALHLQLQIEPWDEIARRKLMRLLALQGRRAAALAQYQACRLLLADELGIEPSPETTLLYEQIRLGRVDAAKPGPPRERISGKPEKFSSPRPGSSIAPAVVCREAEIGQLFNQLQLSLRGQGRVAFIKGDPGSGKTILLESFARSAMQRFPDLVVAAGNCRSYGGSGDLFLPFRQILHTLLGETVSQWLGIQLEPEQDRRIQLAFPVIKESFRKAGFDLLDQLSVSENYQRHLVGVREENDANSQNWTELYPGRAQAPPDKRLRKRLAKSLLFEQVASVFDTLSSHYPLLFLVDDLQWIDNSSASLFFHLGRSLGKTRILILGAFRPGDIALGSAAATPLRRTRHPLSPILNEFQRDFGDNVVDLDRINGRDFVEAFVDTEPNRLDGAFRNTLYQHTGGHALFTVEFLRGLEDRGDLIKDEAGRWVVGRSLDWEQLPARVEAVIAERVDRLPPDSRAILAAASVQGQEFTAEVAARVRGIELVEAIEQLSGPLSKVHRLVRAQGVIYLDGRRMTHFTFRHFLFQQYIYQQLDEVERVVLHEATGQTLEGIYGDQREEHAVELARHFKIAGLADKAADYLVEAGRRAYLVSAYDEAVSLFLQAIHQIQSTSPGTSRDEQELKYQMALSAPLRATQGYASPTVGRVYARMCELAQRTGDTARLFQSQFLLWSYYLSRADYPQVLDLAKQLQQQAKMEDKALLLAQADLAMGTLLLYLGRFSEARGHLDRLLSGEELNASKYLIAPMAQNIQNAALICAARILWFLGQPDQALKFCERAQEQVKALDDAHSQALTLAMAGSLTHLLSREYRQAEALAEELLQLSTRWELAFHQSWAKVILGSGQVERGRIETGLNNMREGMAGCRSTDHRSNATMLMAIMGEACLKAQRPEQARQWINKALGLVHETGERFYLAEVYRLEGEVLLQQGENPVEAETLFQRAILVAHHQEAKSLELRAINSLARIWLDQGKREEAAKMLVEIYGWFPEGLNTVDLLETEDLLKRCHGGPIKAASI